MDVRLSAEQEALGGAATRVVDRLGVHAVAELDDAARQAELDAAVVASGWRELRTSAHGEGPWASAVEVAIVAEQLGRGLADASFLGSTLAADLRRLAGAAPADAPETVALTQDLAEPACDVDGALGAGAVAIDHGGAASALALLRRDRGFTLGSVPVEGNVVSVDLTRPAAGCRAGVQVTPLVDPGRPLGDEELATWRSLGLAVTCADLVGAMSGVLALTGAYARRRRQFGATIGSFQAVQHLLADALAVTEGSRSIALHAAWAVDAVPGPQALAAASAAKAYCARAGRSVCETAIQVHGGIGNTWDCLAHVYLRRVLFSSEVLGGVGASLARVLAAHEIGAGDGLR